MVNLTSVAPQIWVGQGLVNCGAPLATDTCVLTTTMFATQGYTAPVSYYGPHTFITTFTSSEYVQYPLPTTLYETVSQFTDGYGEITYTNFVPCDGFDCSTVMVPDIFYTLLGPSYKPTVTYTLYTASIATPSLDATISASSGIFRRAPAMPPAETARSTATSTSVPSKQRSAQFSLQKRASSRGDTCQAAGSIVIDGDKYQINDLVEVCRFVGNYMEIFVSLAPTAAAYMPTWVDYLISFIIGVFQMISIVKSGKKYYTQKPGAFKLIYTVLGLMIALIRTIFASVRLATHSADNFKTLPFISPLLWVDWLVVTDFGGSISRIIEGLGFTVSGVLWCICLWLCIGYGSLGYGTQQYEVLDIPAQCRSLRVSWETDPRRVHFLRIHIVVFAFASLALAFMQSLMTPTKGPAGRQRVPQEFDRETKDDKMMRKYMIAWVVTLPTIAGILCAAILNRYDYLMFNQDGCWASYVSGRLGYIDVEFVDWKRKIATWIGLNF